MKIKSLNTLLIAASVLSFAACNKENGLEQAHQDRSLSFDLSMAAASHDTDESGASTKSLEIKSADGSICLPLEYSVTEGIGEKSLAGEAQTKGEQINYNTQLQTIGSFKVKAWNSNHSVFLPTGDSEESTVNFTNGKWTLDGETAPLWKNADEKTFFAYANLPIGAEVTFTGETSQLFSYPALQPDAKNQKDALLGYYQGIGDRDGDGVSDGLAKVQFIHPLTAVVFKQGDFEGITAIKSLSIEEVYDGGEAIVTYAYGTDGKLVPTIDWGTSRSTKITVTQTLPNSGALPGEGEKLGESFIMLPQNLSTDKVTIKAVVTASTGDQEIMAELNTGEWEAGKTNTYTLGYDARTYSYEFTLSDGATSVVQQVRNIKETGFNITLVNKKIVGTDETACEWLIKSVQVGSGEPETINDTHFENKGGISASKTSGDMSSVLRITLLAREAKFSRSSHDYWRNQNPTRTDYLDWSPDDWSSEGTIDLSRMDFSKDNPVQAIDAHAMTTANCYVIRHAGTYMLPLVYGNAVVNGLENEQSYYPDASSGGSSRLIRFVNSTGDGIDSPFIENAADCGGSGLKCAVVWQDKAEVVKNLHIVDGASSGNPGSYTVNDVRYLQFDISQNDICQNNAVICVYIDHNGNENYDSGEAVWSWHIWTTNDPMLLSDPISVSNRTDVEYKFFPIFSIGWKEGDYYPELEDVKIVLIQKESGKEVEITLDQLAVIGNNNGCFYQFGRKDPMCPVGNGTTKHPAKGKFHITNSGSNLSNAICTPDTFYAIGVKDEKIDWCTESYYNLWTGKKSTVGITPTDQNDDMIKTIYDPSPVGYKVPASAAFSGFTKSGMYTEVATEFNIKGMYAEGWDFYTLKSTLVNPETTPTIFFPNSGCRMSHDGLLTNQSRGYYWTANPYSEFCSFILQFKDQNINPAGEYARAMGYSIRPVQE